MLQEPEAEEDRESGLGVGFGSRAHRLGGVEIQAYLDRLAVCTACRMENTDDLLLHLTSFLIVPFWRSCWMFFTGSSRALLVVTFFSQHGQRGKAFFLQHVRRSCPSQRWIGGMYTLGPFLK